jgi:hypothetical protein
LQREHRHLVGAVVQHRLLVVAQVPFEPAAVIVDPGGVDDQQQVVVREPVGDQVVDRAAVLVQQQRLLGVAGADAIEVVREHPLGEGQGAGAPQLELPHVRDVEDAGRRSHRLMLGDDALVLHRHLPAGEGNDPRTRRDMAVVQRRPTERGLLRHFRSSSLVLNGTGVGLQPDTVRRSPTLGTGVGLQPDTARRSPTLPPPRVAQRCGVALKCDTTCGYS